MNIHPVLVHFPIAMLTIYAIAELIRIKKITDLPYWFYVKACILFVGVGGAFISLSSGEGAEESVSRELRPLVEVHSTVATISTWIFVFLALVYLIIWINKSSFNQKLVESKFAKLWSTLVNIANKIMGSYFMILVAFIGLISITITGALGGAIVYGPDIDPIVNFVYHIFM